MFDSFPIRVKFKYYLRYMHNQTDDSPLYLFESAFSEKEDKKSLVEDYAVSVLSKQYFVFYPEISSLYHNVIRFMG